MAFNDSLTASDGLTFNFVTDEDGNYGFLDSEGEFMAFSGSKVTDIYIPTIDFSAWVTSDVTAGGNGGGSFSFTIGNLDDYKTISIASSSVTITGYKSNGSTQSIGKGTTDITDIVKIVFSSSRSGNSTYSSSYSVRDIYIKA